MSIFSLFTAINVPGKAPGGVYTDLHNAGIIGDILYRFNDVLTRWVAYDTWTYEGQFTVTPDQLNYKVTNLVLHGVDTVAFVELNDHPIGSTDNMFVRYVFDIKKLLQVRTVSCLRFVPFIMSIAVIDPAFIPKLEFSTVTACYLLLIPTNGLCPVLR